MRKNYFAKKFVAYSMAFAVAFSTLTVSPVFVKDAKADYSLTAAEESLTDFNATDFAVQDGALLVKKIMKDVNTTLTQGGTPLNSTKLVDGLGVKAAYIGVSLTETDDIANSTAKKVKFSNETNNLTVANVGTRTNSYQLLTTDMIDAKTLKSADVPVQIDGTKNVDFKIKGAESATPGDWYKLNPVTKTLKWIDDNSKSFNLTVEGYEVKKVLDADGTDDETLTFNEVTKDDLGQYIFVATNTLYAFVNLYQQSDLVATTEKDNIYAAEGSSVKLAVDTKSTSTLTYTWKKGTKTLLDKSDKAEYTIDAVGEKTIGAYTCEVSDGVCIEKVSFNVQTMVASNRTDNPGDKTITAAKDHKDANVIRTDVFGAIQAGTNDFPSGQYTLTTSLPSGDYHYIWRVNNNVPTLDSSSILAYSSKNKTITFKNPVDGYGAPIAMNGKKVTCYAVPNSVYDADKGIEDVLKKIAKASNDYDKAVLISTGGTGLLDEEDDLVGDAAYEEHFYFATAGTKEVKNEVKTVKMGGSITLEAPTVNINAPTQKVNNYVWEKVKADGTSAVPYSNATNPRSNKLTIENLDQFDLGVIRCTVNTWVDTDGDDIKDGDETTTGFMIKFYNLVCESDLTATPVDTQVKNGQDATLAVKATSTIPVSYRWEYSNDKFVTDVNTVAPAPTKGFTNELKVASVAFPLNDTYRCVVTDGFKDVYVPVKLEEIETFKAYFDEVAQKDGTKIKDTNPGKNNTMTVKALEGEKVTLSPIVVAASETIEKDLTYTWTKNGLAYSTDKIITVEVGASPVTYELVITEGTAPLTIEYTVEAVDSDDIKGYTTIGNFKINALSKTVYTGKEINPVKDVYYGTTNTRYYLKEGVDYTVALKDAVNAGISVFTIELKGDFADYYNTLTDKVKEDNFTGTFAILRAENKVEIADNTVVLGKSVQPKTVTNLGKGALTYTYYADADCATEIAAPTKVGTYYVKATANATMNYNEAESNVAKVVVVPGKVKMLGTSRTASSVKLNWKKATGATSYRVYYKAAGAKSYKVFKNTTATSMNVTGLASATTYTFAVKAYAKTAGYSTVYATKQTTTAPAKVATPSVTAGSKKATVKFTKVARATGYQIYMAKGNGKYVKVKTTTSTSFTKTGLAKGATYKFKVRAYKTVGSNTYYGAFSSAKAVVVK